MKALYKIAVCLLALSMCLSLKAQNDGNDMFVPIAKYLSSGSAENLEISVVSSLTNSSKSQAKQILKSFFETYTPRKFEISHIAGRPNMKYALGTLNAGGETFNVTIFVSVRDGDCKIQQLKIERVQ